MAITRKEKEALVAELADKISKSKAIVFTDFRGLSVEDMSTLRGTLREKGLEFKVLKNTLFRIAAKQAGTEVDLDQIKNHPVGAAFSFNDEVDPAKLTYEFSKKNDALELVGGVLNGKAVSLDQIKTLALMPSREEMYAKIVGSLASPLRGVVTVLSGNLRGLVTVLSEYQKTR